MDLKIIVSAKGLQVDWVCVFNAFAVSALLSYFSILLEKVRTYEQSSGYLTEESFCFLLDSSYSFFFFLPSYVSYNINDDKWYVFFISWPVSLKPH